MDDLQIENGLSRAGEAHRDDETETDYRGKTITAT
jgi:hypothetical protein